MNIRNLMRLLSLPVKGTTLAAAGALSAPAFGQQVTVYGLMDVGVTHVSNQGGDSTTKLSSGELQQSRLGFRGTEDLGGGLQAFFNLEHGLSADTGAAASATQFWSREARLGLRSPFGTLAMGRQAASLVDYLGKYTAPMLVYGPGYYATHPGDYDRVLNLPVDNSVKYDTPNFGGFSAGATYGFGEQPGSSAALRTVSAGAGYDTGPFSIGIGYLKANGPILVSALLAPAANPFTASNAGDSFESYGVGASYAFGPSLIYGLATEAKFNVAGTKARTYEVGAKYVLSVWTLGADLSHTDVKGRDASMNIVSVSAAYAFSKRIDVYAVAASEHVSGTNIAGGALVAQMFSQGASSSSSQNVVRLALRHKF